MSDTDSKVNDDLEAEYARQEPTEHELRQLEDQFRSASFRTQYVAKPAPGHDVHGIWHTFEAHFRSGYAAHGIALHYMLSKQLGIPTQLIAHPYHDVDIDRFPEDRYDMLFEWHKEVVGHPHAVFASYPPDVAAPLGSADDPHYAVGPNIIPYCAFEGFPVSSIVADACNNDRLFRRVWTVSDFSKHCFVASGVNEERVDVVRPPMCDAPWTMRDVQPLADDKDSRPVYDRDPFVFGMMGTWIRRKGIEDLLRAYFTAFERQEPVSLWIRTSSFEQHRTIRELKEELTERIRDIAGECGHHGFPEAKTTPHLHVSVGTGATDDEVIEWLSRLDGFANPSYGEGLGIPHIWAKAHGVPLVTSEFGAVGDLVREFGGTDAVFEHTLRKVDADVLPVSFMFDNNTQWGGYEPSDMADAMRRCYEQGRRADVEAAHRVQDAFSAATCLPDFKSALAKVLSNEPQRIREWNL